MRRLVERGRLAVATRQNAKAAVAAPDASPTTFRRVPEPSRDDWSEDLALALELCDAADTITTERFRAHDLHVETKPDLTPVSEADHAVEAVIRDRLAGAHPDRRDPR